MYFFNARSAVGLDFPHLPGPGVWRVQRVPVLADRLALRQHSRSDPVDERVQVDRHEVVLVEDNPLDRLDEALALDRIEARLVLGPERFDLRLAYERRRAPADGVHGDVRLRAAGTGIDVLHDRPVARNALSALADLRPERRAFQRLELSANSDRAQIGQDPLAHVEIGWEGQEFDLDTIRKASLRHQLLGLFDVVLRHRGLRSLERVAIFATDPVPPGLADVLRFLLHEKRTIDREADGLAHALVPEGAPLLVIAGEHEPPRPGEVRIPSEIPVRHEARKELAGHPERDIELSGLQAGHARGAVSDALDHDRLGGRRAPPVVREGLELHLNARLLADELVRPGADRLGLESVPTGLVVIAAG